MFTFAFYHKTFIIDVTQLKLISPKSLMNMAWMMMICPILISRFYLFTLLYCCDKIIEISSETVWRHFWVSAMTPWLSSTRPDVELRRFTVPCVEPWVVRLSFWFLRSLWWTWWWMMIRRRVFSHTTFVLFRIIKARVCLQHSFISNEITQFPWILTSKSKMW